MVGDDDGQTVPKGVLDKGDLLLCRELEARAVEQTFDGCQRRGLPAVLVRREGWSGGPGPRRQILLAQPRLTSDPLALIDSVGRPAPSGFDGLWLPAWVGAVSMRG